MAILVPQSMHIQGLRETNGKRNREQLGDSEIEGESRHLLSLTDDAYRQSGALR